MNKLRLGHLLMTTWLLGGLLCVSPVSASSNIAGSSLPFGLRMTIQGKVCTQWESPDCGLWNLEFDPASGPVKGSYYVKSDNWVAQGTLTGTGLVASPGSQGILFSFENGLGPGVLHWTDRQPADNEINLSWAGHLNMDGTGEGYATDLKGNEMQIIDAKWTVTFDPVSFQAATPTAIAPSVAVVGEEIQLSQEVRNNITRCPLIDDATKSLLNQDSVLIVRDDNGQFYAINNQKKTIPLPVAVKNVFDITNELAILKNDILLDKAGY